MKIQTLLLREQFPVKRLQLRNLSIPNLKMSMHDLHSSLQLLVITYYLKKSKSIIFSALVFYKDFLTFYVVRV